MENEQLHCRIDELNRKIVADVHCMSLSAHDLFLQTLDPPDELFLFLDMMIMMRIKMFKASRNKSRALLTESESPLNARSMMTCVSTATNWKVFLQTHTKKKKIKKETLPHQGKEEQSSVEPNVLQERRSNKHVHQGKDAQSQQQRRADTIKVQKSSIGA